MTIYFYFYLSMCSNDFSAILILSATHSLSLPSDFVFDLDYKIFSPHP